MSDYYVCMFCLLIWLFISPEVANQLLLKLTYTKCIDCVNVTLYIAPVLRWRWIMIMSWAGLTVPVPVSYRKPLSACFVLLPNKTLFTVYGGKTSDWDVKMHISRTRLHFISSSSALVDAPYWQKSVGFKSRQATTVHSLFPYCHHYDNKTEEVS